MAVHVGSRMALGARHAVCIAGGAGLQPWGHVHGGGGDSSLRPPHVGDDNALTTLRPGCLDHYVTITHGDGLTLPGGGGAIRHPCQHSATPPVTCARAGAATGHHAIPGACLSPS